ncbi:MAG: nucleotide exchange factor GrpE [Candidatus Altiarchaeota archaeon]
MTDKQTIGSGKRKDLKHQLKEKETHVEELTEKLAWLQAEFDNYQKRIQKERTATIKYSNKELLLKTLDVKDNLERALKATNNSHDIKALTEGVKLTLQSLELILEKEGVSSIKAKGEPFDPVVHEALMTVPTDEHSEDHIVEEIQTGYKLHDQVLRPAKVKVAVKKG